jgi:hypothetical protein
MPGKRLADLHGPALSHFQRIFNCQLELQHITWTIWKNETSLFGRSRSNALEALDRELKNYHAKAASADRLTVDSVEELGLHAVVMYYALDVWKKDPNDKNPTRTGPNGWKYSTRNTSGIFERLDDILSRYVKHVSLYSSSTIPPTEAGWLADQQRAYEEFFVKEFKGAKMKAKASFVREQLAVAGLTVGTAIADRTGLTGLVNTQVERGTNALGSLAAPATNVLSSAASSVASSIDSAVLTVSNSREAEFMRTLMGAVGARFGHAGGDSTARLIREAIRGLNIADAWFRGALVTIAEKVGKAVYELLKNLVPFATLLQNVGAAAVAFYKAIKAHMDANEGKRNRFIVRSGSTTDAYNAIVNFWDEECKESLKDAATSLAKAVIDGVCLACGPVGQVVKATAAIADKVYQACKSVWDTITKILDVVEELEKAEKAMALMTLESNKDAKEIFELSPLLATYYFLSLDSSAIVMLESKLVTMSGFTSLFPRLKAQIEPVIEKAGEYLAASSFMWVNAQGKPFPVRAKLGDPSLMEQIKALATGAVEDVIGNAQDAVVEAATTPYVSLVQSTIGMPAE